MSYLRKHRFLFFRIKQPSSYSDLIAQYNFNIGNTPICRRYSVLQTKKQLVCRNSRNRISENTILADYQLFVFDDSNLIYLYNYHKILSPSPWIYHYFWSWRLQIGIRTIRFFIPFFGNLQFHKTRFILDCSAARNNIKNKQFIMNGSNFFKPIIHWLVKDSSNRRLWRIQ